MIIRPLFTLGLLVPVLALGTGYSTDDIRRQGSTIETAIEAVESADGMSCAFAIRAKNNMSFDVWVDLYESRLDNGGWGVFGGFKPLEIQTHRIFSGKSMDRRYTASGDCSKERRWEFAVHIGRTDGKKIYKYVYKSTRGSGDRTIDLGNSSTWGL